VGTVYIIRLAYDKIVYRYVRIGRPMHVPNNKIRTLKLCPQRMHERSWVQKFFCQYFNKYFVVSQYAMQEVQLLQRDRATL